MYRTGFQTFLAGQLMVRAVELSDEEGEPGTARLTAKRSLDDAFLGLPFEEALAFFREKRLISASEFDSLQDRYRAGGFIARQLATERLREVARASIERLLAEGRTLGETVTAIRQGEVSLGVAPSSGAYLETVIRTNVQVAYGHGRWAAMNDPNVIALRPYQQYWTANDSRVRENHRVLHGLVVQSGSDLAARVAPPGGYNCRCAMTTLSARQLERRGLSVSSALPSGGGPDEGWEAPPAPLEET